MECGEQFWSEGKKQSVSISKNTGKASIKDRQMNAGRGADIFTAGNGHTEQSTFTGSTLQRTGSLTSSRISLILIRFLFATSATIQSVKTHRITFLGLTPRTWQTCAKKDGHSRLAEKATTRRFLLKLKSGKLEQGSKRGEATKGFLLHSQENTESSPLRCGLFSKAIHGSV